MATNQMPLEKVKIFNFPPQKSIGTDVESVKKGVKISWKIQLPFPNQMWNGNEDLTKFIHLCIKVNKDPYWKCKKITKIC